MNKKVTNTLIGFLVIVCLLDIGSFLYEWTKFNIFDYEINPMILILKLHVPIWVSMVLAVIWKIGVNASLIYILLTYKPKNTHLFAYMLVYGIIFAIILQGFGVWSNIHTAHVIQNTPVGYTVAPLTQTQSVHYISIVSILYYFFTGLSMLSFWIYEKLYVIRLESKAYRSAQP